jgi:hypothetical protein
VPRNIRVANCADHTEDGRFRQAVGPNSVLHVTVTVRARALSRTSSSTESLIEGARATFLNAVVPTRLTVRLMELENVESLSPLTDFIHQYGGEVTRR